MKKGSIIVVNKHDGEPYDVYIGRGSPLGNPFKIKSNSDAERE